MTLTIALNLDQVGGFCFFGGTKPFKEISRRGQYTKKKPFFVVICQNFNYHAWRTFTPDKREVGRSTRPGPTTASG